MQVWYTYVMTTPDAVQQIALALSDPLRLAILDLLAAGRTTACASPYDPCLPEALCAADLQQHLGAMTPSKLAYHLKELREAGLVREQRRGKWVYYELNHATLQQFVACLTQRYLACSEAAQCAAPND